MANAATAIQTTADVLNASNSLLASLIAILPTLGYIVTIVAAFVPQPTATTPYAVQWLHKAMTYIAFNIKHARNTEQTIKEKGHV